MQTPVFLLVLLLYTGCAHTGEVAPPPHQTDTEPLHHFTAEPRSAPPSITAAELAGKMIATPDSLVIIDLRNHAEQRIGTIPRSRSVTMEKVVSDEVIDSLPRDLPIILYCSHGFRSQMAARSLCEEGFQAFSLVDGYAGWQTYMKDHPEVKEQLEGNSAP